MTCISIEKGASTSRSPMDVPAHALQNPTLPQRTPEAGAVSSATLEADQACWKDSGNYLPSNPSDPHNSLRIAPGMSLPRRAMEQMGFSVCCLMCDAPDVAGTTRCKECIKGHTRARDRLTSGKARTKAQRLARELVTMLADPFSHTEDDTHGKWMQTYSEMIREHQHDPEKGGERRLRSKRLSRKTSLIREVGNKNKWTDNPPDDSQMEEMRDILRDGDSKPPMTWDDLISEIEEMLDD